MRSSTVSRLKRSGQILPMRLVRRHESLGSAIALGRVARATRQRDSLGCAEKSPCDGRQPASLIQCMSPDVVARAVAIGTGLLPRHGHAQDLFEAVRCQGGRVELHSGNGNGQLFVETTTMARRMLKKATCKPANCPLLTNRAFPERKPKLVTVVLCLESREASMHRCLQGGLHAGDIPALERASRLLGS